MLPHDVVALPRLFPVMLRVPAIARAVSGTRTGDLRPFLLRRLAFDVLRELLVRIARIASDWCSSSTICNGRIVDGALLLEELLRPPDAPALLTVVSFRSEEVAAQAISSKAARRRRAATWDAARARADAGN